MKVLIFSSFKVALCLRKPRVILGELEEEKGVGWGNTLNLGTLVFLLFNGLQTAGAGES